MVNLVGLRAIAALEWPAVDDGSLGSPWLTGQTDDPGIPKGLPEDPRDSTLTPNQRLITSSGSTTRDGRRDGCPANCCKHNMRAKGARDDWRCLNTDSSQAVSIGTISRLISTPLVSATCGSRFRTSANVFAFSGRWGSPAERRLLRMGQSRPDPNSKESFPEGSAHVDFPRRASVYRPVVKLLCVCAGTCTLRPHYHLSTWNT
jgi:hypothetical protein